jgi:DNA-directed RNA polymerase specialized sigma24 family protein
LQAYLVGFARNEILQYLRSERRRRSHEATGGRLLLAGQRTSQWPIRAMLDEFAATLNRREQEFLEEYLLAPPVSPGETSGQSDLSPTNIWQRRHRLRFKLKAFLKGQ